MKVGGQGLGGCSPARLRVDSDRPLLADCSFSQSNAECLTRMLVSALGIQERQRLRWRVFYRPQSPYLFDGILTLHDSQGQSKYPNIDLESV